VQEAPSSLARAAGLRYVNDAMPGIARRRRREHFTYVNPAGSAIRDADTLARIRALAVPPAYEDVWICPLENGHIQATGRDARGRKQYRYHARWRELRDETKYAHILDFARALPRIRRAVRRDLRRAGTPREKILAAVVHLLETTTIRVGNDEYARDNDSFGLTTLCNRHARVHGDTVTFAFRGKSGVKHAINLRDRRLARIVRACQDLPGQQLFEYTDSEGAVGTVDSSDVNAYIRDVSGGEFTAKDFRTWIGTVSCALVLAESPDAATQSERTRNVVEAIKIVAARLGNTPAVCRKCYVHPELLAVYLEKGSLGLPKPSPKGARGMLPEDRFVMQLLRRGLPKKRARS
jgi:DNA topoisomerase-1